MGEIIKKYGTVSLNNNCYDIELNGPISNNAGGIIHIQNDKSRAEMSQKDFYKLVSLVNLASVNLQKVKGKKNE